MKVSNNHHILSQPIKGIIKIEFYVYCYSLKKIL